ncbi:pepSY domain protein [Bacteroides sp. CAG:1076]|nr:pepSY domain protein [Bacteroides sp. CAG:1076]
MKKIFKKIHLWLSVPFGLIISIICLTGATLVFEKELTRAGNPHLYTVEYKEGSKPLKPSEIIARISQQTGDTLKISSLQVAGNPKEAWMVSFTNAGQHQLSVNPYSGEINGWVEGNSFFQTVRKLHRWLLDAPAQKGASSTGKTIVGITTLLMVVILISGIVLWWPRTRKSLQNRLKVSCTKGPFRFWYDSHVSLGFYVTIFLLVMALTGLTWSFRWYRTGFYALFGASTEQPKQSAPAHEDNNKKEKKNEPERLNYLAWDAALAELQNRYETYGTIQLSKNSAQVIQSGKQKGDTASFDIHTGNITEIKVYNIDEQPMSNKMKGLIYSLHTGQWGGMFTRIIYFLSAFIGGILPLTGYYLWIKRINRKHRRNV